MHVKRTYIYLILFTHIYFLDSAPNSSSGTNPKNFVQAVPEITSKVDDMEYLAPANAGGQENIKMNDVRETTQEIFNSSDQDTSTYMSLKNEREPDNVYQALQPPSEAADSPHAKESNDYENDYENLVSTK